MFLSIYCDANRVQVETSKKGMSIVIDRDVYFKKKTKTKKNIKI